MKAKTLISFLSLFVLALLPARAQLNYSYNTTTKAATVNSYSGSGGAVVIPASVTNASVVYSVTTIGADAFGYGTTITSIGIPSTVTSIGASAFEDCNGLTNVTIPNSVTNIGDNAFDECSGIMNFTVATNNPDYSSVSGVLFNSNQTTVVQYPAGSEAASYTIPESVTNLGLNSFEGSSNLKFMMIPGGVQNIGVGAFSNCGGLTNAVVGAGVANLSDYAFYDCPVLTNLIFLGDAPPLGGSHVFQLLPAAATVYYLPSASGWSSTYGGLPALPLLVNGFSFVISNNVAIITGYTGTNGNVSIPAAIADYPVTIIGDSAFVQNDTLTSVVIPDSVTNIGVAALAGCLNLTNITVASDNPAFSSLNGVLFDKNQTTLIQFAGDQVVNYTIPNSVTNIGQTAFAIDLDLRSVTFPSNVTEIGIGAFEACTGLTNVVIGSGVTSIGIDAFAECEGLTNVIVSKAVKNVDDGAFALCSNVTSVIFLGNAPVLGGTNVFVTTDSPVTYEPVTVYYLPGTSGWGATYGGVRTALLTSVVSGGFAGTFNNGGCIITGYSGPGGSVTIPDSIYGFPVTAIGGNAFANNDSLTSIVIPNSVTNIGVEAFYNCAGLASVTMPNGIISIGAEAFYNCASLASVAFPQSLASIGAGAFDNCLSLTSLVFSGNEPTLGNAAFAGDFATVYYYAGTMGWGSTYGGLPTVELAAPAPPQIKNGSAVVQAGSFSFTITGATNQTVVVGASTNLVNWQTISTNTLSGTNVIFSDSQWTNYPVRYYRVR
jgi:hypothetical protein